MADKTGAPDLRITIFDPTGQVIQNTDASEDFGGGSAVYDDTPSGCASAILTLGLRPEELVGKGYWATYNIVELSTGDDVLTHNYNPGDLKLYCTSTIPYDPVAQGEDIPQLYLWDGTTLTMGIVAAQISGQYVGTDGNGPYINVTGNVGGAFGGGGIPFCAAGAVLGRRRYTGRIIRRTKPYSRQPQSTLTCTGLLNTFNQAIGSFAYNNYDVGPAIYQAIQQFAARWAFLSINSANFPTTGSLYTGSGDRVQLSMILSDILSAIATGDLCAIRVGHDRVPRLIQVYVGSSNSYTYTRTLTEGTTYYEPMNLEVDDDASNLYNSVEVIGNTDPTIKQPFAAIVQDTTSIGTYYQVDAAPVSNTKLNSVAACASYATSLLNQSSQPQTNQQLRIYTRYDTSIPAASRINGLNAGDVIRGFDNVLVQNVDALSQVINAIPDSEIQYPGQAGGLTSGEIWSTLSGYLAMGWGANAGPGGSGAFKATVGGAAGTGQCMIGRPIPVVPGTYWVLSGWLQFSAAAGTGYIDWRVVNAANHNTIIAQIQRNAGSGGARVTAASVQIPSGVTSVVLIASTQGAGTTGGAWSPQAVFSQPQFQKGSSADPYVQNYALLDQYGLVSSVETVVQPGRDTWQDVKFAAIEPDWRATIGERTNSQQTQLRQNQPQLGLDQYFVAANAWPPNGPEAWVQAPATAATGRLTLGGTPTTGDSVGWTIGGFSQTYSPTTGQSLAQVATGLKNALNGNANISALVTITQPGTHNYLIATAVTAGSAGNNITTVATWSGQTTAVSQYAKLQGGTDQSTGYGPPSGAGFDIWLGPFLAVFALNSLPVMCGSNVAKAFTLAASTTTWAWLNPNNTWTLKTKPPGQQGGRVAGAILFGIFQTDASNVIGGTLKATVGYLGIPGAYVVGSQTYTPTTSNIVINSPSQGPITSQIQVQFKVTNQPTDGSLAACWCWYRQHGQTYWLELANSPANDHNGNPLGPGAVDAVGLYTFLFPDAANALTYDFGFTMVDRQGDQTTLTSGTSGTGWLGSFSTSQLLGNPVNLVWDSAYSNTQFGNNNKAASSKYWSFYNIDGVNCYLLKGGDANRDNAFVMAPGSNGKYCYAVSTPSGSLQGCIAVTPGDTVVGAAYIDTTTITGGTEPVIQILDMTNALTTGWNNNGPVKSGGGNVPVLGSWTANSNARGYQYTSVVTIPSGCTQIALMLTFNNAHVGSSIAVFAEPMCYIGGVLAPYSPTYGPVQQQKQDLQSQQQGGGVLSGCLSSVTAALTQTNPGGEAVVEGFLVNVPSQSITYPASNDSYNDVDATGVITTTSVANGGTPPAIIANGIRLEKVVTNATQITSVSNLATPPSVGLITTTATITLAAVGSSYTVALSAVGEFQNLAFVLVRDWNGNWLRGQITAGAGTNSLTVVSQAQSATSGTIQLQAVVHNDGNIRLDGCVDTNITSPSADQLVKYTSGKWTNVAPTAVPGNLPITTGAITLSSVGSTYTVALSTVGPFVNKQFVIVEDSSHNWLRGQITAGQGTNSLTVVSQAQSATSGTIATGAQVTPDGNILYSGLGDVSLGTLATNNVSYWNGSAWTNTAPFIATPGDLAISGPAQGHTLVYSGGSSKFTNQNVAWPIPTQSTSYFSASVPSDQTITLDVTANSGDYLVAFVDTNNLSMTTPTGWTLFSQTQNLYVFYRVATANSSDHFVTSGMTGFKLGLIIAEYFNAGAPTNANGKVFTSGTNFTPNSSVTPATGSLIFALIDAPSSQVPIVAPPWDITGNFGAWSGPNLVVAALPSGIEPTGPSGFSCSFGYASAPVTPSKVAAKDNSGAVTTATSPWTVTFGAAPTTGNLDIMVIISKGSPNTPAGWTAVSGPTHYTNAYLTVFARIAQTGDPTSVSVSFSASTDGVWITSEWTGTLATVAAALTAATPGTSSTVTAVAPTTTVTPLTVGGLYIEIYAAYTTTNILTGFTDSPPGGFTTTQDKFQNEGVVGANVAGVTFHTNQLNANTSSYTAGGTGCVWNHTVGDQADVVLWLAPQSTVSTLIFELPN